MYYDATTKLTVEEVNLDSKEDLTNAMNFLEDDSLFLQIGKMQRVSHFDSINNFSTKFYFIKDADKIIELVCLNIEMNTNNFYIQLPKTIKITLNMVVAFANMLKSMGIEQIFFMKQMGIITTDLPLLKLIRTYPDVNPQFEIWSLSI